MSNKLMRDRDPDMLQERQRAPLLSAPEQWLPPEILSEIFLISVLNDLYDIHHVAIPWRRSVLLPGQICRYWRNIAISTPRLWSALILDVRLEYTNRELNLATIWFARSGGVPLTIALLGYYDKPQTHPVIDVVVAHAPRWYILRCEASLSIVHRLRGAKGKIPLLRHLFIFSDFLHDPPIPQSFDTFEMAPELRTLYLWGQVSELRPKFPWVQLSELHLFSADHYTVDDCLQMLHNMPNLLTCKMSLTDPGHSPSRTIIRNSTLREFHVDLYDLAPLFERLALPTLRSLTCRGYETWPREEFLSFLQRSSCPLQSLILEFHSDSDEVDSYDLTECLRNTPRLTELKLRGRTTVAANSFLFHEMSYGRSSPPLVPKLRSFEVVRHTDLEFDYDAFVAMVKSRWCIESAWSTTRTAGEKIESVAVVLEGDPDEWDHNFDLHEKYSEAFEHLRRLQEEGLVLMAPDIDMQPSGSGFYTLKIG
jgi:hypothetical protein